MSLADFDKDFEGFVTGGNGSAIKDIYDIIPSLSKEQMQVINTVTYYAEKWELTDLKSYILTFLTNLKGNKNLSFLSSFNMKSLLKAYTMDEAIRGIRMNGNSLDTQERNKQ